MLAGISFSCYVGKNVYLCKLKGDMKMSTATYSNPAMNNLWNYIQGLSLSASDRQWLADRLVGKTDEQQAAKSEKELVFPHFDDGFVPSESLLSMALGPLPERFEINKQLH